MKRDLSGNRVIVTGAAGNLGRALCHSLGEKGCNIVAVDRDKKALQKLQSDLAQRRIQCEIHGVDLLNESASARLWKSLADKTVHGLILNAGITRIAPFAETDDSDFRRIFGINVLACVAAVHILLPALENASGFLVGISSVSGFAPLKFRTAYSASKHALAGFLESLRAETQVDVSLVYPSFLTTEIRADDRSSENPAESRKARGSLTPDIAAKRIARAIESRSKRLYIPLQSAVARILWNFAPSLYFRIMDKRA